MDHKRNSHWQLAREQLMEPRHRRMPTNEAGYTQAVVPDRRGSACLQTGGSPYTDFRQDESRRVLASVDRLGSSRTLAERGTISKPSTA